MMIKNFAHSLKEAFQQMWRNKGMSVASIFSITCMLLILGLFFFLTVNVSFMSESIKTQFDTIEVFLFDDTSYDDALTMKGSLEGLNNVASVEYIGKDQAMEEFKESWGDKGYMLDGLASNPLPNSLRVKLVNLDGGELVATVCRGFEGVEDVRYYQSEVNKILAITEALQKVAMVVIAFLVIVSVVVVSNTVKLTVMARKDEIMIMKYVGATNWFIRGPMLLEGVVMGLFSAIIGGVLCSFAYFRINTLFGEQVYALFSASLVDPYFMIVNLAVIFAALGISIGAFGSIISMRRYLNEA